MVANKGLLREILEDLPMLYKESPQGVTLRDLHAWYGEPHDKLAKTIKDMADERMIDLRRGPANVMIIFPRGKGKNGDDIKLTPLQLNLFNILKEAYVAKGDALHTNYARLSQVSKSAYGTVRAAILKLVELQLIVIEQESERGRQDQLVIRVTYLNGAKHANLPVRKHQVQG